MGFDREFTRHLDENILYITSEYYQNITEDVTKQYEILISFYNTTNIHDPLSHKMLIKDLK